ncbi:7-dehydrosterol-delta 7-reductase [Microsporum canis CBS 113480]|uniref:7-dehydrocholesterol reductase n=1 Tax=Arthroderma otae (strain ATCC MYA-4605 / CBS 113480) TaxID=554155 RepID=C5FBS5_ARTOC|nr:7-dehydrosterol-delta 7-reductase [Microsporum canis CBS 113480]EEQ27259.1 7-dehydrosterol-delta 7-reductase [Microsporum canis CBS 113480]
MPDITITNSNVCASARKRPFTIQGALDERSPDKITVWGRKGTTSALGGMACLAMMVTCPMVTVFWWASLSHYDGSLYRAGVSMVKAGLIPFFVQKTPGTTLSVATVYGCWTLSHVILYSFLPGTRCKGQLTPAGNLLEYKINGFLACVVSIILAGGLHWYGLFDLTFVAQNWGGFVCLFNIYGLLLALVFYIKAHVSPTHPEDRKFSGSVFYDFYMGIEFNPRLGADWDMKLFHNGRPGMIGWLIVYLKTLDMCHDHFGFYFSWGIAAWLPVMYTLQTQYLATHPINLSSWAAALILATANHQKYLSRATNGKCKIWGKSPEFIRAKYKTAEGSIHESLLLCSGWWGLVRHANYLGDLILSYSMCATCGFTNLLPWTYAIYMTILLVHRCYRDEVRCYNKYGESWKEYCAKVPYRIIPGIF